MIRNCNRIFIAFRISCLVLVSIGLTLQGISLRKDSYWDEYVTGAIWKRRRGGGREFQVEAYQSLWGINVVHDLYQNIDDEYYDDLRVYPKVQPTYEWKKEVLRLETVAAGTGGCVLGLLFLATILLCCFRNKKVQVAIIATSITLSITAGTLMVTGAYKYYNNYQSVLQPVVEKYKWWYHMTDDTLAMGCYFALSGGIFFLFAALSLIVHLIMTLIYPITRDNKTSSEGKQHPVELQHV